MNTTVSHAISDLLTGYRAYGSVEDFRAVAPAEPPASTQVCGSQCVSIIDPCVTVSVGTLPVTC